MGFAPPVAATPSLSGLSDVVITAAADNDVLAYNAATSKWTDQVSRGNDLLLWSYAGAIVVGSLTMRLRVPVAYTFVSAFFALDTAPAGSSAIADIEKNGVSIFTTRPTILAAANSGTTTDFASTTAAVDDILIAFVDQVGSGTAGSNGVIGLFVKSLTLIDAT